MVFQKKKGRGIAATGRKVSNQEDLCYSNLDANGKRRYDRLHKQKSRQGSYPKSNAKEESAPSSLRSRLVVTEQDW